MTPERQRLSGQDLTFWWVDSPVQPTTMAMLLVTDRPPDPARLRHAFARAVEAVPRLTQRVVEAPLDLTLPHWETDPTFDLEYHLRHHALAVPSSFAELLHEVGPVYETPFDRSRPLWECRIYEGLPDGQAAMFFKLHHAVADGVGANAIFAALTDAVRDDGDPGSSLGGGATGVDSGAGNGAATTVAGGWSSERSTVEQVLDALRDQADLTRERLAAVARGAGELARHPEHVIEAFQGLRTLVDAARGGAHLPLERFGRARRLTGLELPFDEIRQIKRALGGTVIDVLLTILARAMGRWYRAHDLGDADELMTLVPVNLRKPEEWTEQAQVGNVATGLLVRLPIGEAEPLAQFREIRRRVEERKADPSAGWAPLAGELMSLLPRSLFTWMASLTFGSVDFIVTNVPGIPVERYLAGAEIVAAYPFAPVAIGSPVSVALYGYRSSLFIGLDSDQRSMPDVEEFGRLVVESFAEMRAQLGGSAEGGRPGHAE